ncbi:MAG: 50S ribosomal protein L5 [Candidatus Taylorbacteria bacterium RIFCSPHIGHO2_01_FULL_46_22b]|uniref:Large ribosomal subunit protein uL5 n=1 Tax=Candidatus Taylorbacteria bacterium RIFCSPHIGHO2_01_FULL_46_22b TaxID=1802301 RepID=A0A1G2M2Q0_9BACT|nr:MAG: 50S ribosomal protein L5 [Candidatus Taylorbacteria bacterium RIFCSPHIGHO2_01_FULL_46_22b]
METTQKKQSAAFGVLQKKLGITNPMQSPRLVKVVVNAGTGSFKDKKKNEIVIDRLLKITGQKPAVRGAKKSIASFKLRQGDPVGYQITLRGRRMMDFLDRLLNIAFPRTKDFKGISTTGIDEMGNLTVGIKEHIIFPETVDEELKDIFGIAVTVVTTAKDRKTAKEFFTYLGFPFKKEA